MKKSPFEELGLICNWAMEEAAMQKFPDYKEIISSNPPVVFYHLASILHCLSYLFSACISSPISFYYSSYSNTYISAPPRIGEESRPPPLPLSPLSPPECLLLCRNPLLSTCCVTPAVLFSKLSSGNTHLHRFPPQKRVAGFVG